MSAFNTLLVNVACPVCGCDGPFEVQFKHGDTWQLSYHLGDTLRWGGNDYGVKESGLTRVEGVGGPCSNCSADNLEFEITVRDNRLEAAIPRRVEDLA